VSQGNGVHKPGGTNSDATSDAGDSEPNSTTEKDLTESGYRKLLDDVDPTVAKQIIDLIQADHRYEHNRATWNSVSEIFEVVALIVGVTSLIGVVIFLSINGEKSAAQTLITVANLIAITVALWRFWLPLRKGPKDRKGRSK
jgi:hypothetical protein